MKIVVIGAGAMGCLYGSYLSKKNEVIMLDSYQPQVEAINTNGITVLEENGEEVNFNNIKAYPSGSYQGSADLIIFFVKTNYSIDALAANKHLFGENTRVLTLQNGAGNDLKLSQFIDKKNIVIGTSKHNSVNLGSGKIRHSGNGLTTIGNIVADGRDLTDIKDTFNECGFNTEISEDIQRVIWNKLFVNLAVNSFTAITLGPIGYLADNKYSWDYAEKIVCEAADVANAIGVKFTYQEALDAVHHVAINAGKGYSSMSQDVMNFRLTEVDAINGAVCQMGKNAGVATPYNDLVTDIIHAIEGAYQYRKKA